MNHSNKRRQTQSRLPYNNDSEDYSSNERSDHIGRSREGRYRRKKIRGQQQSLDRTRRSRPSRNRHRNRHRSQSREVSRHHDSRKRKSTHRSRSYESSSSTSSSSTSSSSSLPTSTSSSSSSSNSSNSKVKSKVKAKSHSSSKRNKSKRSMSSRPRHSRKRNRRESYSSSSLSSSSSSSSSRSRTRSRQRSRNRKKHGESHSSSRHDRHRGRSTTKKSRRGRKGRTSRKDGGHRKHGEDGSRGSNSSRSNHSTRRQRRRRSQREGNRENRERFPLNDAQRFRVVDDGNDNNSRSFSSSSSSDTHREYERQAGGGSRGRDDRNHQRQDNNEDDISNNERRRNERHRHNHDQGSIHSGTGVVSDDENDDDYSHYDRTDVQNTSSKRNEKLGSSKDRYRQDCNNNDMSRPQQQRNDRDGGHFNGEKGSMLGDFRVLREVGIGTFGRVVECLHTREQRHLAQQHEHLSRDDVVAIKVVRNVKRYYDSALIEADIVRAVNHRGGRGITHCAVLHDTFSFHGHLCMVFEKLGPSLYDFMKNRMNYRPYPVSYIRHFATQLLQTAEFLHSFGLIHTDLKMENILLVHSDERTHRGRVVPASSSIKVIDFGGATYNDEKKTHIINTRQYRAPEVILETGWSMPSDIWSIGCIIAELYQGELLFATHDNVEHLALIEKIVGPFPKRMLDWAQNRDLVHESFSSNGAHRMASVLDDDSLSFVRESKRLENMVRSSDEDLLILLRNILVIDPDRRATAKECLQNFGNGASGNI